MPRRVAATVPSTPLAPADAPGVDYFVSDHAPGLRMFRCAPLAATLTIKGCAARHLASIDAAGEQRDALESCRRCPIGSAHSGRAFVRHSAIYQERICPACRRGAMRMIHNRACVSCYNRRRELEAGRNARGHAPKSTRWEVDPSGRRMANGDPAKVYVARPLRTVALRIISDPRRVQPVFSDGVVDILEPIVQTLRTSPVPVAFAWASAWQPRQLVLAL